MKLPNGERAIVDIGKLQGTALIRTIPVAETRHVCLHQLEFAKRMRKNSERPSLRRPATRKRRLVLRILSDNAIWSTSIWSARAEQSRSAALGSYELKRTWVVAMLEDLPEEGLVRGQVGTVVESWVPGVYEVEFCDDTGKTYAKVALKAEQLMQLHHEPVHQAA